MTGLAGTQPRGRNRPSYTSKGAGSMFYRESAFQVTPGIGDLKQYDCTYYPLATRYVSASAGGGGTGDILDPWTLAEAVANVVAGDEVLLMAGSYGVTSQMVAPIMNLTVDGTEANPIVWRALPDAFGLSTIQVTINDGIDADSVAWNWFWGLEVTGDTSLSERSWSGIQFPTNAPDHGIRVINCHIHDINSVGSGMWGGSGTSTRHQVMYGTNFYATEAPGSSAHQIYIQQDIDSGGMNYLVNNYHGSIHPIGGGDGGKVKIHGFTSGSDVTGIFVKDSIFYDPRQTQGSALLFSDDTGQPHHNTVFGCHFYDQGIRAAGQTAVGSADPAICHFIGNFVVAGWYDLTINNASHSSPSTLGRNIVVTYNTAYTHRTGTQTGFRIRRDHNIFWGNTCIGLFSQNATTHSFIDFIFQGYDDDVRVNGAEGDGTLLAPNDVFGGNTFVRWFSGTPRFHTMRFGGSTKVYNNLAAFQSESVTDFGRALGGGSVELRQKYFHGPESETVRPNDYFYFPNDFEKGRGRVVVYNHEALSTLSLDLSTILEPGDWFELRDPEDFFGTALVAEQSYEGDNISYTVPTPNSDAGYFITLEVVKTSDYTDARWWNLSYTPSRTFYISDSAGGSGIGTREDPYDLAQALAAATAGDEFLFLAGTYGAIRTTFMAPTQDGTKAAPIVWRAEPDQFGLSTNQVNILGNIDARNAAWNWWWGIEITDDPTSDADGDSHFRSPTQERGVRLINSILHDVQDNAIGAWGGDLTHDVRGELYYGNIVYNVGTSGATPSGDPHNIYFQNSWAANGYRWFINNYLHKDGSDTGFAFHGFGGGHVEGSFGYQNVVRGQILCGSTAFNGHRNHWDNNYLYAKGASGVGALITLHAAGGGSYEPHVARFTNNYIVGGWQGTIPTNGRRPSYQPLHYWTHENGLQTNPDSENPNIRPHENELSGNTWVDLFSSQSFDMRYHLVGFMEEIKSETIGIDRGSSWHKKDIWKDETYYHRDGLFGPSIWHANPTPGQLWGSSDVADHISDVIALGGNPQWGKNCVVNTVTYGTFATQTFAIPNTAEPGRGRIVIYNHGQDSSININVSTILAIGQKYDLRNIEDFHGTPAQSGTVSVDGEITVSVATPDSDAGYFMVFELIKTGNASSAGGGPELVKLIPGGSRIHGAHLG